jgi:hypothetical protein
MNEKQCTKCDLVKNLNSFGLKNSQSGKRQSWCKACHCLYTRQHYRKNKAYYMRKAIKHKERRLQYVLDHLSTCFCVDCGENDSIVLEFDHVKGVKEFNILKAARSGMGLTRLKQEMAKCEIRCANCHRRRHYANTRRSDQGSVAQLADVPDLDSGDPSSTLGGPIIAP